MSALALATGSAFSSFALRAKDGRTIALSFLLRSPPNRSQRKVTDRDNTTREQSILKHRRPTCPNAADNPIDRKRHEDQNAGDERRTDSDY